MAGLVAVPIVLSKKADETPAPAPEPATSQAQSNQPKGPDELAQVKLEDSGEGNGSSLSAFDASDPFAPPQKVLKAARDEAQGDTGATPPRPARCRPAPTPAPAPAARPAAARPRAATAAAVAAAVAAVPRPPSSPTSST